MNKLIMFMLGAGVGAGIGAGVTWMIAKEKYKKIADEEIESVIEYYKRKEETESKIVKVETFEELVSNPELSIKEKESYENQVEELGYSPEDEECIVKVPQGVETIAPYVIAPEEFGELGEMKSLMYYTDGILADDDNEIVVNPELIIGDALEHFGEYEDDSVHVRNEDMECDFEILKSMKTFSEVCKEDYE